MAGSLSDYDYALQTLTELPYDRWREFDPEDSMRFYALRLHEVGMIKLDPEQDHRRGHRLALPERAQARAEGVTLAGRTFRTGCWKHFISEESTARMEARMNIQESIGKDKVSTGQDVGGLSRRQVLKGAAATAGLAWAAV